MWNCFTNDIYFCRSSEGYMKYFRQTKKSTEIKSDHVNHIEKTQSVRSAKKKVQKTKPKNLD